MLKTGRAGSLLALFALLGGSCTGQDLARNDQGRLQPQTVRGPCQVKKFFLLGETTVPTDLTTANTGEACELTLINYALDLHLSAALVNQQAAHGRAAAGLLNAGQQAAISYTPLPGYAGPDQFRVTLEPGAVGITFNVTVTPRT